jgi:hypothetical protein
VGVPIDTDFRTSIQFEGLLKEYDLTEEEQQVEFRNKALLLYYPIIEKDLIIRKHVLKNISEAIERMMWFYRCGKELKERTEEEETQQPEILSYEHDEEIIKDAILAQYHIDLWEEEVHWWKFKAMLGGLNDDNKISQIMNIRAINLNEINDNKLKEHYRKMKKIFEIPKPAEEVEEDNEISNILLNGGDLSQLKE